MTMNGFAKEGLLLYTVKVYLCEQADTDIATDPVQANRGIASFKAFRLTPHFIAAQKQKKFTSQRQVLTHGISSIPERSNSYSKLG
jgi:hypothetical protein